MTRHDSRPLRMMAHGALILLLAAWAAHLARLGIEARRPTEAER